MYPGEYLTPTIRLVRPLGQGGMGSVWLAEHLTLQTSLAIKFCLTDGPLHPAIAARFQREAALALRAKGPNVVQIFDHGFTQDGTPYIAMELLLGEDLATYLQRQGKVEPAEFAPWLNQVAGALSRAHALGVVHRDIKPSNLFLCNEGDTVQVKVLDFGVAKNAFRSVTGDANETALGAMIGTPAFMSPEQITQARDADFRTDLWALGAVTYLAITGEYPFQGNAVTVLSTIGTGAFLPVTQRCSELPSALDTWMTTALAVDPARRFQSATALAAAFGAVVNDSRRGHTRGMQRAIAAGCVASAIALLGVGGVLRARGARSTSEGVNASSAVSVAVDTASNGDDGSERMQPVPTSTWEPAAVTASASVSEAQPSSAGSSPSPSASSGRDVGKQPVQGRRRVEPKLSRPRVQDVGFPSQ